MSSEGGEAGGGGGEVPPIKATITPPNCLLAITGANRFAKRLRKKSLESKERAVKVRVDSSTPEIIHAHIQTRGDHSHWSRSYALISGTLLCWRQGLCHNNTVFRCVVMA